MNGIKHRIEHCVYRKPIGHPINLKLEDKQAFFSETT